MLSIDFVVFYYLIYENEWFLKLIMFVIMCYKVGECMCFFVDEIFLVYI